MRQEEDKGGTNSGGYQSDDEGSQHHQALKDDGNETSIEESGADKLNDNGSIPHSEPLDTFQPEDVSEEDINDIHAALRYEEEIEHAHVAKISKSKLPKFAKNALTLGVAAVVLSAIATQFSPTVLNFIATESENFSKDTGIAIPDAIASLTPKLTNEPASDAAKVLELQTTNGETEPAVIETVQAVIETPSTFESIEVYPADPLADRYRTFSDAVDSKIIMVSASDPKFILTGDNRRFELNDSHDDFIVTSISLDDVSITSSDGQTVSLPFN